jgi:DNA-binding SARP family transcriptional activator
MEQLFPDLAPDAAAANLRKAVHFARRTMGSPDSLQTHDELLALVDAVVDVDVFERAALRALRTGRSMARVAADYGGDLLPEDRYAAWAEAPRERLRALHLRLLKAGGLWDEVLAFDPGDEEAHRGLMQRALDVGDRQSALRQFERLRERLRADLGVGPSVQSVAVYEQALALEGDEPAVEERARALLARALVALNRGVLDEADRLAAEAREVALAANLGRETGEASAVLGIVANIRGQWPQHFRDEFIAAMRADPEVTSYLFDAHRCLAEYCLCGARGHEALAPFAEELTELARQERSVQGQAVASLLAGEIALFSGRLDQAAVALTTAVDLHARAGASSGEALSLQRVAELAIASGRRPEATTLARGLRLSERAWLRPHVEVRIRGVLIDAARTPRAGVALVRQADDALAAINVCPTCAIGFHLSAARSFAVSGVPAEAARRLELAERVSGMWPSGAWHAAVWETRGVLRRETGDAAQASAMFREAATQYNEVGRPLDRDRCLESARVA